MAARNKDVRCERVVFGSHRGEFGFDLTYRRTQPFKGVLKTRSPDNVH
jgi:hypothetical protein